jgi:NAD(P) transhydrogenase subunit beta
MIPPSPPPLAAEATPHPVAEVLVTPLSLAAVTLFVRALKWLSAPSSARRGVLAGEVGMGLAVGGALVLTLLKHGPAAPAAWVGGVLIALALGAAVGAPLGLLVPMTAVPQRTALSHAFGALAACLVGVAHYYLHRASFPGGARIHPLTMAILGSEVLLGGLTFTGSLMAFANLQELLPTRPITYLLQNACNQALLGVTLLLGAALVVYPGPGWLFPLFVLLALAFGVLLVLPIGGADMPTVISLLNAYAGLSAGLMGFVLGSNLLIVAGALDGSSGLILALLMCRAMNRSLANVLFGAFGQVRAPAAGAERKVVRETTPLEAAQLLEAAGTVVVVPGYGMAVAQAQHAVRELYRQLTARGVEVNFAVHPVAGRMPGHMNVLLAEAEVPYESLAEMDAINPEFPHVDVALVVGANDVTNPAARHDKASPIYGMPILDVDRAHAVIVIKRGLGPGFAGIDNELYYLPRTLMLFGDARDMVGQVVKELEAGRH